MDSRTDVFSSCDNGSNAVAKSSALIGSDIRWAFLLERKSQKGWARASSVGLAGLKAGSMKRNDPQHPPDAVADDPKIAVHSV
jgi:hypothetical protein